MDLFDNRLAVSKLMGATHIVNTSQADPVAAVKEITNEMMCDIGAPAQALCCVLKAAMSTTRLLPLP